MVGGIDEFQVCPSAALADVAGRSVVPSDWGDPSPNLHRFAVSVDKNGSATIEFTDRAADHLQLRVSVQRASWRGLMSATAQDILHAGNRPRPITAADYEIGCYAAEPDQTRCEVAATVIEADSPATILTSNQVPAWKQAP